MRLWHCEWWFSHYLQATYYNVDLIINQISLDQFLLSFSHNLTEKLVAWFFIWKPFHQIRTQSRNDDARRPFNGFRFHHHVSCTRAWWRRVKRNPNNHTWNCQSYLLRMPQLVSASFSICAALRHVLHNPARFFTRFTVIYSRVQGRFLQHMAAELCLHFTSFQRVSLPIFCRFLSVSFVGLLNTLITSS